MPRGSKSLRATLTNFARKTPWRKHPPWDKHPKMPTRGSPAQDWKKFVVTSKVKSIVDAHLKPCDASANVEREFCRALLHPMIDALNAENERRSQRATKRARGVGEMEMST